MMKNAVYAGSFDPITLGHIEVIEKSHKLFDHLYVVIAQNTQKKGLFTVAERQRQIATAVARFENVSVVVSDRLTVQAAQELQAQYLIRGVRGNVDLESEMAIAELNSTLDESIQTLFIPASSQTRAISSSMIKEIASFGGDVTQFVPQNVVQDFKRKFEEQE
ncbi:phosphopantetheine adenylyltransferase [Lentilactobacillus senioris DSM 24302 = JCM 17472]|uniref:Phosphopantetheine adenylyltransferase n=1 Tax=Lentilactobacillus senioris DSM 24302 = JCM 17472 TaxID=1423802 RepID=A0A0R2D1S9_9LACO|nr:pantetheine-phosphate adenylyltransferase [Lentilactobacillus senioris]KRM94044.1 phosphopantetheine adenylyltransferase [Lentilactobacillus senioris DSM 24302 = JCM 17472]